MSTGLLRHTTLLVIMKAESDELTFLNLFTFLFSLLAYPKLRPFKQVQAVCHLVATTQSLVHLNLWGCKLGDEGTFAIAAALATKPPTSDAHGGDDHSSSSSSPSEPHVSSGGPPEGVSLSWRGSSLETLDLGFNNVTDAGLRAISKALKANKKLKHLDFRKNQITTEGVEHLCEVGLHFFKSLSPFFKLNQWPLVVASRLHFQK